LRHKTRTSATTAATCLTNLKPTRLEIPSLDVY
jgi:hypothetical protein